MAKIDQRESKSKMAKDSPVKAVTSIPPADLADEELLDCVQRQTFRYFWEAAHPVSGLASDRWSTREEAVDDRIAIGGSGFGIMAIIVALARGWVSREEALDRIGGRYGFVDAFCETRDWYASTFLAINQGPIIIMIENYRTGLLWKLFVKIPEIQAGLRKLGFTSPYLEEIFERARPLHEYAHSACARRAPGFWRTYRQAVPAGFITRPEPGMEREVCARLAAAVMKAA